MPSSLDGRVALVTGSTRGLGKQIALELARRGARVAMNYFGDQALAENSFAELQALGSGHTLTRADVTDEASIENLVREVGPFDLLVLNATCSQPQKPVEEYDWAFGQRMVDFFIKSPFLLTKACLPHMKQQRWGRIIHITSEVFDGAFPNFSLYSAAKGGQIGLAKSNAAELAPYGITVNQIAPGWIPVERHANDPQEAKDAYLAGVPMGKFGEPKDVANAVAYLASDEAAFVTGASLSVNGGHTIT